MRDLEGRLVLVTGAASGIGRATALAFARAGCNLALCDVDEKGLVETRAAGERLGVRVRTRRVDVAVADDVKAFADEVHQAGDVVDVLINNAGVGLAGGFLQTSLEDWRWIVNINLWGVIHGCHFFLPRMVERGKGGHVVNLSSAAGIVASELLCAYSTTKFGVFGLSEGLRDELEQHRIGVTTVCPGVINTPIVESTRMRSERSGTREQISAFYRRRNYGPEKVASAILAAVRDNRAVLPVSPEAWAMYYMKRAVPSLALRLVRRMAVTIRNRKT